MWWQEKVFYELYVPSFSDGNGDGIGDFKGIISKLDYLKELGVGAIWLTPFYSSPKVDNGYDISDYKNVDSDYGTMEEFEFFMAEAKKRNIKVIADLVLNHVSDKHFWFQEAKKSKDNPYRNYFFWEKEIPNNWESFFSGSAWELDKNTNEYYYHKFAPEQVDLNWTNPKVKEELFDVMKFWLDKGLDGFRLDVINFLTCKGIGKDNPKNEKGEQDHKFDINQDGILEIISELSTYVKSFGDKFLVGEIGSDKIEILKKYSGDKLLDVVFNFNLGSKEKFDTKEFYNEIISMEKDLKSLPTLFFSSHDMSRHISRFGEKEKDIERAKAVATLFLTGYGVPFIYYGDEFGMTDRIVNSVEEMKDIQGITNYKSSIEKGLSHEEALKKANEKNRDKSRAIGEWDKISVEENNPESLLNYYKYLIKLRNNNKILQYGKYKKIEHKDETIIFVREYKNKEVEVCIDFKNNKSQINFK